MSSSERLLRTCGAQIRTMLVRAASEQLGVPESELVAKDSAVTHISTGRRRTYGELAHAAANSAIPHPDSVMLKEPKDWTYIGKSFSRLDAPAKVDGTARIRHRRYAPRNEVCGDRDEPRVWRQVEIL